VVEGVEHRDEVHRSIRRERVQITGLEANVREPQPLRVGARPLDTDTAVIEPGELDVGPAPRQLARGLPRTAAEIEHRAHAVEPLCRQIGEAPDGQIARVGGRERIVPLWREHVVVELAIARSGPGRKTPAKLTEWAGHAVPRR
jgi:hypothetical protein